MLRVLLGFLALAVTFGPLAVATSRLRAAVLPTLRGAAARLAELLSVGAVIVLVTQVLGLLGLYRLWAVVPAYLLVALLLWSLAGARTAPDDARTPVTNVDRPLERLAMVLGIGLVAGSWSARAAAAYAGGIQGADTLWYHLPSAARLVQSGSLREIQHFDAGNLTAYYPNASTFFHATGMVFLESDILSPVINHAWAAVALLAAFVLGQRFGRAALVTSATAVALSFPGFVGHQAASAMNDITGFAFILGALALLAAASPNRFTTNPWAIGIAGASTGVALATKWTVAPTTAALTGGALLVILLRREHVVRNGLTWLVAAGATGLFTFVRNLVIVGNPLPPVDIAAGPIAFDRVAARDEEYGSLSDWLTDDVAWEAVLRPGLDLWFGPLWIVAIVAIAAGLLASFFSRDTILVLAGVCGAVSVLSYVLGPQNLVLFNSPQYFISNVRYGIAGFGLGLIALVVVAARRDGAARHGALALVGVLMIANAATVEAWSGVSDWRYQDRVNSTETAIGGIVAVLVVGIGLLATRGLLAGRARQLVPATIVAAIGVAVIGQPTYIDQRFDDAPFWNPAVELTDARIALDGINTQFMMYGDDMSNHVEWLGLTDNGYFEVITRCADWVELMNDGEFTHAIYGPTLNLEGGVYEWASLQPNAVIDLDYDDVPEATLAGLGVFIEDPPPVPLSFFTIEAELESTWCPA